MRVVKGDVEAAQHAVAHVTRDIGIGEGALLLA